MVFAFKKKVSEAIEVNLVQWPSQTGTCVECSLAVTLRKALASDNLTLNPRAQPQCLSKLGKFSF